MPLLLLIDTTTTLCSVAIARDNEIISEQEHKGDFKHAELLTTFIQTCCALANCTLQDVNGVVISKGPGSYTGLRIGTSTAKGICYALHKPLIAINTLHAMAISASATLPNLPHYVCAMIDARRMEVYDLILDEVGRVVKKTSAQIVEITTYNLFNNAPFYYCGDGAAKCEELLAENKNAHFLPNITTRASNMLPLALVKYAAQEFEDVAYFEPYYLKDFIAGKPKQAK
ncbi:MAG: tRNA (adenosine(37)-N6)-threonylcarbamoyltransferase complex dimerization subunit type 1 TsaB [Bacteroidia bacterium]|nr:tRNA (adenosine(37)-N6)-threonylcarbamoyltransferase complex dimerization subunit type 1 TsaB [Bacteroidia bacterium]